MPSWIPVTKRLPKSNTGDVLVTVIDHETHDVFVSTDSFLNYGMEWCNYGSDVVAWMPLPEPYDREEE